MSWDILILIEKRVKFFFFKSCCWLSEKALDRIQLLPVIRLCMRNVYFGTTLKKEVEQGGIKISLFSQKVIYIKIKS